MSARTMPIGKVATPALSAWIACGCPDLGPLWNAAAWEQSARDHAHGGDVTCDLLRSMTVVMLALGMREPRRYDATIHANNVRDLVKRLTAADAA